MYIDGRQNDGKHENKRSETRHTRQQLGQIKRKGKEQEENQAII